ncbi:MAG: acyl-CoA thioesterase [Lachnospiraceae bacterium]|jgi:acyl-CoA thioester hydrolase|nr:acyl-CoA thioesterase [Lachnospiraceae bacterium]MDE7059548.1 acyl-CoA thioesterase [Lachnospiraceae bacterium]
MEYLHQAQYYETDQMGIIHHSNYIRWMEEARIAYMDEMGFPYQAVEEAGIVSPVLEVQCAYKAMTYFGERILIEVELTSFKGVKYELSYVMREEKSRQVRATGTSSHCYLKKDGHLVNIRKELPLLYEKMVGALKAQR